MLESIVVTRAARTPRVPSLLSDLNAQNATAGLSAILFYAFGAAPFFLGAMASLGMSRSATASWFFVIFLTTALVGIPLSLRYRQPLAVGPTLSGLVFLVSAGHGSGLQDIAGASLMAGLLMLALGATGAADRVMRWFPLPLVMGVFAGSALSYVTDVFTHLDAAPTVVGPVLAGYLAARAAGRVWLPPLGAALLMGLLAAGVTGQVRLEALTWELPTLEPVRPAVSLGNFVALAVPLTILTVTSHNVPGFGFLAGQGYRPPVNVTTVVMGLASLVNSAFGGQPVSLQRGGLAILAGEDAGPRGQRYVANIIAAGGALVIGLCAASAAALLGVFPPSLVISVAGLGILGPLMDAARRAMGADRPLGPFFAFAIAASPLSLLGIGSAFWGLVGGVVVSACVERGVPASAPRPGTKQGGERMNAE